MASCACCRARRVRRSFGAEWAALGSSRHHWPTPHWFSSKHQRQALRGATSLPQIPGVILTNKEIPNDRMVGRIRHWAAQSPALSSAGGLDLLQLSEAVDGKLLPRAVCGLLRTSLQLSRSEEKLPAVVALFYRTRDHLNKEFWEDQVRRLCDIVAAEYLGGRRGVQLMVHHSVPQWAMGLEIGDHRLLAEVGVVHVLGRPSTTPAGGPFPEWCGEEGDHEAAAEFNRLTIARVESFQDGAAPRSGTYTLRGEGGAIVCGVRVLGSLPWRLVCSEPWAKEGHESELASLVHQLRRTAGRPACSLMGDRRDAEWQRLCGVKGGAPPLGVFQLQGRARLAVTGVPMGLTPEEQVALAKAPLSLPWEFLPFHAGSILLI